MEHILYSAVLEAKRMSVLGIGISMTRGIQVTIQTALQNRLRNTILKKHPTTNFHLDELSLIFPAHMNVHVIRLDRKVHF